MSNIIDKLTKSEEPKPFLKWVGGKRSILEELKKRMPDNYGAYREPFVGGGALFFSVYKNQNKKNAYLSDINQHLITTYKAVQQDVNKLMSLLDTHIKKHNKKYFYSARTRLNTETDAVQLGALMIYLNKTCFNGLYRVNKAGQFNVPMGDYKLPVLYAKDTLMADSTILQGVGLKCESFEQVPIINNDFYYFDPPYHKTYSSYSSGGFGEDMQVKLAAICSSIADIGGFFMQSNSDTPFIRKLYRRFNIEQVYANRSVSSNGDQRGKANELIIRSY
jgi:DNA adenine methylase